MSKGATIRYANNGYDSSQNILSQHILISEIAKGEFLKKGILQVQV